MKYLYKFFKKVDRFRDVITAWDRSNSTRYGYMITFQNTDGSYYKWNSVVPVERDPAKALKRLKHIKKTTKPSNRIKIRKST